MQMSISDLKERGLIIMEAIVGSVSYGLATTGSDVDRKGVYVLPAKDRFGYEPQMIVSDEKNNNTYWELSKFIQLLNNANPGALELLYSPDDCIEVGEDWFHMIRSDHSFLTQKCQSTFAEYAKTQISKARGMNKKVFNPMPKARPQVLDFCYIIDTENGSVPFKNWLADQSITNQKWYAAASIDHAKNCYSLYRQDPNDGVGKTCPEHEWRWAYGVVRDESTACDLQLCSVPKGQVKCGTLFFNHDAYATECRRHTEYWDWVDKRNPERYASTLSHGQGYDAKNMMHCIRLLMTARDIALLKTVVVDRKADRDYLLSIKNGNFTFDEVMDIGTKLIAEVADAFKKSDLPDCEFATLDDLSNYLYKLIVKSRTIDFFA